VALPPRFDDTNPTKKERNYLDSIQADGAWLGYGRGDPVLGLYYFERSVQLGGG